MNIILFEHKIIDILVKVFIWGFIALVLIVAGIFFYNGVRGCGISDEEAIDNAKQYCEKLGLGCSGKPIVLFDKRDTRSKTVRYENKDNSWYQFEIKCRTGLLGEFTRITNSIDGRDSNISSSDAMEIIKKYLTRLDLYRCMNITRFAYSGEYGSRNSSYGPSYYLAEFDLYGDNRNIAFISIAAYNGNVNYLGSIHGMKCDTQGVPPYVTRIISVQSVLDIASKRLDEVVPKAVQNKYKYDFDARLTTKPYEIADEKQANYDVAEWGVLFKIRSLNRGEKGYIEGLKRWEKAGFPTDSVIVYIDALSGKVLRGDISHNPAAIY